MKTFLSAYSYLMSCVGGCSAVLTGCTGYLIYDTPGPIKDTGWMLLIIFILITLYCLVTSAIAEWVVDKEYYK